MIMAIRGGTNTYGTFPAEPHKAFTNSTWSEPSLEGLSSHHQPTLSLWHPPKRSASSTAFVSSGSSTEHPSRGGHVVFESQGVPPRGYFKHFPIAVSSHHHPQISLLFHLSLHFSSFSSPPSGSIIPLIFQSSSPHLAKPT